MAKLNLVLFAAALTLAAQANAQVLVLDTDFGGELLDEDRQALIRAIDQGVQRAHEDALPVEHTRAALGEELAACRGGDCILEIGLTLPSAAIVVTEIYAEAQIYDFTVRVFDPHSGATLATQIGDCTFCAAAEAVEALEQTAFDALQAASPLPAPTRGSAPAPEDPLAEATPQAADEPNQTQDAQTQDAQTQDAETQADEAQAAAQTEAEPDLPPAPVEPAFVAGDILLHISVLPESAEITVNGESVGRGSASLNLAPQNLQIAVLDGNYEAHTEDVTLTPTMAGPIFLRVVMQPHTPARATRAHAGTDDSFNRRAVGGVLLGTGLLATAGGVALLLLDGNTTCSTGLPELCEDVWEFTPGGAALTAIGGIGIGAGIGLLVRAARGGAPAGSADTAQSTPRRDLSFSPLRGGGAMMWQQNF